MDLEAEQVQSVVENVETVEVVAGDDIDSATSSHGLIDQQMIVTHPQEILVPTTEVHSNTLTIIFYIRESVKKRRISSWKRGQQLDNIKSEKLQS